MTTVTLDKQQNALLGRIANAVVWRLAAITFAICIVTVGIGFLVPGIASYLLANPLLLIISGLSIQIVATVISAQLLPKMIQRTVKGYHFKVTNAEASYKWKWFLIVVAVHVIATVIINLINLSGLNLKDIGAVVLIAAYFIATHYTVLGLIKNNDAILEPVN